MLQGENGISLKFHELYLSETVFEGTSGNYIFMLLFQVLKLKQSFKIHHKIKHFDFSFQQN